ncbi:MAG: OmpA family protein [Simkaniaceae bacterium]|nr:OmpA family protein [Simkaniaceae bacterium]
MRPVTILSFISAVALLLTGCASSSSMLWEDTKTAGRYIRRQGQKMWHKETDSRMIAKADDFYGPPPDEFVPLDEEDLRTGSRETPLLQPKDSPGVAGSPVPGIEQFVTPSDELARLFRNIRFDTDEHVISRREDHLLLARIADHMKRHGRMYVFVSGHCDERASEAYNLALGTRRANTVRSLLARKGVDPSRIYTISFGKEVPLDPGHSREAWATNRRVEFKIFNRE